VRGREFRTALFEQFSLVASAFASPARIGILDILAQGERSVEKLAAHANLAVANTSRHLQVLKAARLVTSRKEGLLVFYRLADPVVEEGYQGLQRLARARLPEVDRLIEGYFSSTDGLEPLKKTALLRRARTRTVVVLDVRPKEEFATGHITGALSIPLSELKRRLAEIPPDRRVVAYCRGPYCVLAAEAVRLLRRGGWEATRLSGGYLEWRDAGLPIEGSSPVTSSRRRAKGKRA
jgi:rhodanese-related sulfurtransferase/DNA-binding transcriptional ArsR family regulator